jgi:hypothetical protein
MFMSSEGSSGSTHQSYLAHHTGKLCSLHATAVALDVHAGNTVRAMASGGFERIKVENPVVDLDGDEMTRWAMMFGKHRRLSVDDPVVVMAVH